MTRWVALLRGVNVGGITIRNADLARVFDDLGATAVRTVLASGNVAFEMDAAPSTRAHLKARIEKALTAAFGYDAWIVLVSEDEVRAAVDGFPFISGDERRQPWVIFCADEATRDELADAARSFDPDVDRVAAGPGVVYWHPVKGTTTDTPFAKLIAKATYKPRTTNRNLRTLVKILG